MLTIAPVKTTYRIIFHCKCGVTRAYDYTKQLGRDVMFYRMDGEHKVYSHHDARCTCGKKVKETFVHGVLNEKHICDARCLNATGRDCSCSCGGANHGAKYLF